MNNLKLSIIVDILAFIALVVTIVSALMDNIHLHVQVAWIFVILIVIHIIFHRTFIKNIFKILGGK